MMLRALSVLLWSSFLLGIFTNVDASSSSSSHVRSRQGRGHLRGSELSSLSRLHQQQRRVLGKGKEDVPLVPPLSLTPPPSSVPTDTGTMMEGSVDTATTLPSTFFGLTAPPSTPTLGLTAPPSVPTLAMTAAPVMTTTPTEEDSFGASWDGMSSPSTTIATLQTASAAPSPYATPTETADAAAGLVDPLEDVSTAGPGDFNAAVTTPPVDPLEDVSTAGPGDFNAATTIPPTDGFTDVAMHESCVAAQNGDVYETESSMTVEMSYELLTPAGQPMSVVLGTMDDLVQDYVARNVVDCSLGEFSSIQGIDTAMPSSFTGETCQKIAGYNAKSYYCFVLTSSLQVYLSDSPTMSSEEIRNQIYQTLRLAMNGPDSRRRRILVEGFQSVFVNESMGIADLYFLNDERSAINQSQGTSSSQSNQDGGGMKGGSAAAMGIFFLLFGVAGIVWSRRQQLQRAKNEEDAMQKATVFSGHSEDGNDPHHHVMRTTPRMSRLGEYFDEGIDPITPSTPSQLSCPPTMSGSRISDGGIPSASMLEAYEAAPSDEGQGDGISFSYSMCGLPALESLNPFGTEALSPILPKQKAQQQQQPHKPTHQRIGSDELLEEPPPFMKNIPRSARSAPSRMTPKKNSSSAGQSARKGKGVFVTKQEILRTVSPSSSSSPQEVRSSPHKINEYFPSPRQDSAPRPSVSRTLAPYLNTPAREISWDEDEIPRPDDGSSSNKSSPSKSVNESSFSITAFLNGHCAAMNDLVAGGVKPHPPPPQSWSKEQPRTFKKSPTSVMMNPKTPPTEKTNVSYLSSVNLWTSQCDAAAADQEDDNDEEPWTTTALQYINSFSPYGNNKDPSLSQILSTTPCGAMFPDDEDVSPDRGRSPTPIDDATNARRRLSPTPSRTPRNPPGHKLRTYEPDPDDFRLSSWGQARLRSIFGATTTSNIPVVTPTSKTAKQGGRPHHHFPVYASDTVQF